MNRIEVLPYRMDGDNSLFGAYYTQIIESIEIDNLDGPWRKTLKVFHVVFFFTAGRQTS